ncbi:hypothetical protein [Actinomadura chibensis]|nr:hypothetical protein [Actinomadura chibensis]
MRTFLHRHRIALTGILRDALPGAVTAGATAAATTWLLNLLAHHL